MIDDPRELENPTRDPKHREIHILPPDANAGRPQHRVILLAGGKIRSDQTGNLPDILQELALKFAAEMVQNSILGAMKGHQ